MPPRAARAILELAIPRGDGTFYVADEPACCFQDRGRPLDLGTIRVR